MVRQRGLALVLGTVLTLGASYCALWVLLAATIAGQVPDSTAIDGDPCCPVPHSWGEALLTAGVAIVGALVVGTVLALGVAFLAYGFRARWPSPRRMATVPLVSAAACPLISAASLAISAV